MIHDKKIVVVMPAYNAEKTLKSTFDEIPKDIVDEIILVDDASHDKTVELAEKLGIKCFVHPKNMGYGANQKTCYMKALREGADVTVMLHPDYQYTPKLISAMAHLIVDAGYDVVLGSRVLGGKATQGGMPRYKYISNRILTLIQNLLMGQKLSEYHTGYRAFSRKVLETTPLLENSDDFVFDNQMLAQVLYFGFNVAEVTCPAKYFEAASSINFRRSAVYGLGVLSTSIKCLLQRTGLKSFRIFNKQGKRLPMGSNH
ncbi:MAG: glycosyltransferase family 2 protein [Thermodesulfobacteriota bacterium]